MWSTASLIVLENLKCTEEQREVIANELKSKGIALSDLEAIKAIHSRLFKEEEVVKTSSIPTPKVSKQPERNADNLTFRECLELLMERGEVV